MDGGFLSRDVAISEISLWLQKLGISHELQRQDDNRVVRAVCDSRLPGERCLAFAKRDAIEAGSQLLNSLVFVDDWPSAESSTNLYCKVDDPRAVFIDLLALLMTEMDVWAHSPDYRKHAEVDATAMIATTAVIEEGVKIGKRARIEAGVVLKRGTWIDDDAIIGPNACVGDEGITLYKANDGRVLKFPHVGGVYIGKRTYIGANSVIPQGILSATKIGNDVVIGNLCNIGHGASIGQRVWMSVGGLVGGHTIVEDDATLGMGVTIRDNLIIGNNASVGMGSVVVKNVHTKTSVFGNPAKRMPGLTTGPKR
ncbi:hypothetical protein CEK62_04145 [Alcanivorax sp. N3-2A]|nr:hypothetical protein CEK62_04145 [Alcanivorax sp. N3-2A]